MSKLIMALALCFVSMVAVGKGTHYSADSLIEKEVTVYDADGEPNQLLSLIKAQAKPMSVVFIFGGGGLGHEHTRKTGGLWCPDSFEDLHILRSLKAAYGNEIGIIALAIPPAHHTRQLGLAEGVFLNSDLGSIEYQEAVTAFVDSTQSAFESGTIPVQPFFDTRYNLLASHHDIEDRDSSKTWHGAFRAANEPQTYGVPSLWIVGQNGRILREPFRGNDYHGHGDKIEINYALADVVRALTELSEEN